MKRGTKVRVIKRCDSLLGDRYVGMEGEVYMIRGDTIIVDFWPIVNVPFVAEELEIIE